MSIIHPRNSREVITRILLASAIIAGIVVLIFYRQNLHLQSTVTWVAGFGLLAPLIYTAVRAVSAVLLVPGVLLSLAAGVLFGPAWGAVYNLVGSTIGAVLAFLVARYLAAHWVERKLGGRLKRIVRGVEAEGWKFVAFVRLVPLFPYNLLNYALGLTRIKLSHFTFASLVCMIPGDVAYVYLGYAGREAMAGNESSIQLGLIALGLLACIVFLPSLIKRIRRGRRKETAQT
ncbi:MAG: TVP38/TMEM64 family protein [Proteobacteria bacterium]|nr:TVP38/TMEM64 family protein [Pseudomonadota bacterium]